MDIITQALLGGVVTVVVAGQKLGRGAIYAGMLMGCAPDLDIVSKLWGLENEIIYHRGVSHSIILAPFFAIIMAFLLKLKYSKSHQLLVYESIYGKPKAWFWFYTAFWALVTHPLLDLFTLYGTQLLAPLSWHRFYLSAISIIDFYYSAMLAMALLISYRIYRAFNAQLLPVILCSIALWLSTIYLFFGLALNQGLEKKIEHMLQYHNPFKEPIDKIKIFTGFYSVFQRRVVLFGLQNSEGKRNIYINHLDCFNVDKLTDKLCWKKFETIQIPLFWLEGLKNEFMDNYKHNLKAELSGQDNTTLEGAARAKYHWLPCNLVSSKFNAKDLVNKNTLFTSVGLPIFDWFADGNLAATCVKDRDNEKINIWHIYDLRYGSLYEDGLGYFYIKAKEFLNFEQGEKPDDSKENLTELTKKNEENINNSEKGEPA